MAVHARELMRELERGSVFPVYLLLGEDRGTKDLFIRQLAEQAIPKEQEQEGNSAIARSVFYGGETPPGEILSSLMTYSIFSERTLVIVREFEQVSTTAAFIEYINKPGPESVLVLETASNRVSQRVTAAVEKRGRVCIFWPMFQNEGEQYVARRLADLGIEAGRDAVDYIIELSGTGRSELENQILNISTYLDEGERLSLEKARDIVSQIHGYTVFDLTGAFFTKPARDIIMIFRNLIDNGEEPVKLFFFCNREIEKLLRACALQSAGKDLATIARTLKMRKKESQRFGSLMERMEIGTLRTLYRDLHLLDRTLKSSPRELALSSFERFVAGLGRT